jgi:hypothetical protein
MRKAKKPAAPKPRKELTADEVRERRAEAFFQMEEPLRDCSDRAEIAATLLRAGRHDLCTDIIWELEKMLLALRTEWLKASTSHAE